MQTPLLYFYRLFCMKVSLVQTLFHYPDKKPHETAETTVCNVC